MTLLPELRARLPRHVLKLCSYVKRSSRHSELGAKKLNVGNRQTFLLNVRKMIF
jgi:hypothetical protein